jgi:hypothetical protein
MDIHSKYMGLLMKSQSYNKNINEYIDISQLSNGFYCILIIDKVQN